MRTRKLTLARAAAAVAIATLGVAGNDAFAVEYWLRAAATTVNMPNPSGGSPISVPMWSYALCTQNFASCPAPAPGDWTHGPTLSMPLTDPDPTTLTVHLRNDLSVPTSLVINGLTKSMTPVWTDGNSGPRGADLLKRVRSFDVEAAPNGGTQTYTWGSASNPVKPGTYLYQSGTHPQVQVQMGLYGAVTKNAVDVVTGPTPVRGQAYAPTGNLDAAAFQYDNEARLLYSEIDPALHAAVAAGTYGTTGPTSTFNYAPKYFLVNGQPYPFGASVASPAGNPGTTLLRMLNAGLTTHVPMIKGAYWTLVAEDGKPYSYRRDQYTALLPAAKTTDVLLTADAGGGDYAIMDRRLGLSNAGRSDGGMLTIMRYDAVGVVGGGASDPTPNVAPIAVPDSYGSHVAVSLSIGAADGVLKNDDNTDGTPLPIRAVAASGSTTGQSVPATVPATYGTYTLNTNGSFTYTPAPGFSGADTFTYQITDGKALSASPAMVTINLTTPGTPVLASIDNFNRADSTSLGLSWSQTANTVSLFPDIQIVGNQAKAVSTETGGLAIWNADFGAKQSAGFSNATPLANAAVVLKATGPTPAAPANMVRVRCETGNGGELVISTMMGGSDVAVFVKQAAFPTSACNGNGGLSAVVDASGLVTAFLNGAYIGGVQLPDVGAWKGVGKVGIQLQSVNGTIDNFSGGSL